MESSIIVLDASALLALYECEPEVRDNCVAALQKRSDRIWVADRTRVEVLSRLDKVRSRNRELALDDLSQALPKLFNSLERSIGNRRGIKPAFSVLGVLSNRLPDWCKLILADHRHALIEEESRSYRAVDDLFAAILRDDHVGEPLDADDLERVMRDGPVRFSSQIPPGFCDAYKIGKRNPIDVFGDLVFWEELLRFAGGQSRSILLVTNELKDDWWESTSTGRQPHSMLVREMRERAGKALELVTLSDFADMDVFVSAEIEVQDWSSALTASMTWNLPGSFAFDLGSLSFNSAISIANRQLRESLSLMGLEKPVDVSRYLRELNPLAIDMTSPTIHRLVSESPNLSSILGSFGETTFGSTMRDLAKLRMPISDFELHPSIAEIARLSSRFGHSESAAFSQTIREVSKFQSRLPNIGLDQLLGDLRQSPGFANVTEQLAFMKSIQDIPKVSSWFSNVDVRRAIADAEKFVNPASFEESTVARSIRGISKTQWHLLNSGIQRTIADLTLASDVFGTLDQYSYGRTIREISEQQLQIGDLGLYGRAFEESVLSQFQHGNGSGFNRFLEKLGLAEQARWQHAREVRNGRKRAMRRKNRLEGICTNCGRQAASILPTGRQLASCADCRAKRRGRN